MSKKIKTGSVRMPKLQPWGDSLASLQAKELSKQAERVCRATGAVTCIVVVGFHRGEGLYLVDGGTAPIPLPELYQQMMIAAIRREQIASGSTS